jgi:hypothetical protein
VERRVALVHAKEVAREQAGLVAARTGPDLQDGAAVVGFVPRDEQEPQFPADGINPVTQHDPLVFSQRAHVPLGRGILDQRLQVGKLALRGGQRAGFFGNWVQFGELARQADVFVARRAARQHRRDRLMAMDK